MSFQKIKSSTSRCFDISTAALHIIAMLFMLMDPPLGNTSSGAGMADLCWQDLHFQFLHLCR